MGEGHSSGFIHYPAQVECSDSGCTEVYKEVTEVFKTQFEETVEETSQTFQGGIEQ